MNNYNFLVSISCMTYNQSGYIKDALDGFVMQKTNFPFVATVVDDASTDGEPEVILDYLNENFDLNESSVAYTKDTDYARIIFARHKSNRNCYFAVLLLKENHYQKGKSKLPYLKPWLDNVKYRAYCEGDDFWMESSKLQRQVDYLETHLDVSLSCTRCLLYYQETGERKMQSNYYFDAVAHCDEENYVFTRYDAYTKGWITQTLSMVIRNNIIDHNIAKEYKYYRDTHWIFYILSKGNAVCHNFVGGTYRINKGGVYGSLNESQKYRINLRVFEELYNRHKVEELVFNIRKNYLFLFKYDIICMPKNYIEGKLFLSYIYHNFFHVINVFFSFIRVKIGLKTHIKNFIDRGGIHLFIL